MKLCKTSDIQYKIIINTVKFVNTVKSLSIR